VRYSHFIRNGELKFLVIGGLATRNYMVGWTESRERAEPFDTWEQARDFLRWLDVKDTGCSIIDYADIPPCPPDAEQRRVETPAERLARVNEEEEGRFLQRSRWGIKTAAAGAIALALLVPSAMTRPAAAATHHHHRSHHHHVIRASVFHHLRPARGGRRAPLRAAQRPSLIAHLFGGFSSSVRVAERYLGSNPTGRASLWCADFVNLVERQVGRAGTGSRSAFSYLRYGHGVSDPQPGDIVVLGRRGGGGHVGYVMSMTPAGPKVISGNHGHQVAIGVYSSSRVVAYRRPS
jgi:uncharacterized protein (TIGR02594 family)